MNKPTTRGRRYMLKEHEFNAIAPLFESNWTMKSGENYRNALLSVLPPRSASEYPITKDEIGRSVTIWQMKKKYAQYRDFEYACTISPTPYVMSENHGIIGGNLVITKFANGMEEKVKKHKQIVYLFVEPKTGAILKIGGTPTTSFNGRLGTYGNGRVHLRLKGTGSVTNYRAVQSAFCNGIEYDVYIAFIDERPSYKGDWHGMPICLKQNGESAMETKAKERKATELYCLENDGKPPILNGQKGAV